MGSASRLRREGAVVTIGDGHAVDSGRQRTRSDLYEKTGRVKRRKSPGETRQSRPPTGGGRSRPARRAVPKGSEPEAECLDGPVVTDENNG